jgi:hypothetical protein
MPRLSAAEKVTLVAMDNFLVIVKSPRWWVCALLLLAMLVGTVWGQNQSQNLASQDQPPAGESARATQETVVSSKEAKELFRSVDEILKFASDDTGLPIKHEVKRKLTKRDEVQSYVEKNMKEDKDAKRLERSSDVLKKFGLLPRNFDLQKFLVAMLREQVAGYYDVKTKTVNLLNWVDAEQQKPVLAHELTHALQDQSFGIEKWMKGSRQDADNTMNDPSPADIVTDEESSARQAIIEGQAMVVLLDYTGALLKAGGKELAYAGAFKDPPKTTREIMEPQTYLAHEKLEPLKMIDMEKDFKGYDPFDIGAMGEFDVDILVEQYAGREAAGAIYPEWRGGYYFAGKPKGDKGAPIGLLYVSRWSSPAKAAEFAAVYAKSLTLRYKQHQGLGTDGKGSNDAPPADSWRTLRGRHAWLTEEGAVVIEVRGAEILISESLDDATTERVKADFWPAENAVPAKP